MAGFGPRNFATKAVTIPAGTTGSVVVSAVPAALSRIFNGGTSASVGITLNNAATTGAIATTNRIVNAMVMPQGATSLEVYCNAGIILTFASATADNITVTCTPLGGGA